jgi:hypothetical protein
VGFENEKLDDGGQEFSPLRHEDAKFSKKPLRLGGSAVKKVWARFRTDEV